MSAAARLWIRYRNWYDTAFIPWYNRWAPAMVIGCLATVALVTVGTYSNYTALEADRVARDRENRALLDCFDEYASASSATSTAVREAAVDVDAARVNRDQALQSLFEYIAADRPGGSPRGERIFTRVLIANRVLVANQRALDQVRKDNPVPAPPSEFCELP